MSPRPIEEGKPLVKQDAIDRLRTGNHLDGNDEDFIDTAIMLIAMIEEDKIQAVLFPDGELGFFEIPPPDAPIIVH